jgi:hypothetical protein
MENQISEGKDACLQYCLWKMAGNHYNLLKSLVLMKLS